MATMWSHPRTPLILRLIGIAAFLALASGWLDLTLATQAPPPARTRIDVSKLGPQVGHRVPDFDLKDQNGKTWTLKSLVGPKGAMLVFFRSADW